MRSFTDILTESKKVYEFKIGIAGQLPDGCEADMKSCLEKFSVVEISQGKKTPIQERPLDFPQLENMEVTYYDASVNYPTTADILQNYIGKCCGIDQSHIIVRNMADPREEYQDTKTEEAYEAMLTKEDMGGEDAQSEVASNRIMELLKELETARKEREHDPAAAAPTGESKDIDASENSKAVVGG